MAPQEKVSSRKPYQPPKVSSYGSIVEMTASIKGSNRDNNGKDANKS
jgi:hypothetical protein